MIVAALLLALVAPGSAPRPAPGPTIAAVLRLSPADAGTLVLLGQDHRRIETVVSPPPQGLQPPGMSELELVEHATFETQGCVRKRWTAVFARSPERAGEAATLFSVRGGTEVTMAESGACPDGQYVRVNPGIEPARAFDALAQLGHIQSGRGQSGRGKVRFSCSDSTSSRLCANAGTTQHRLAGLSPWAVSFIGETVVFWLGTPGQVVTEVRFDTGTPDRVFVDRRIPAPA
ncbi:hypothetical protein EQZ23_08245 [Sphingomonas sp. UV9]|uniref:hypothetical protein n=1 Tax=Sphingomonas sp. UV9 TaxID=1851410 RepID=UPI000FFB090D|nr:hypothetical protein [Sphingomonas sp. UV9]RXD05099.1 hypothetical protein EQZ23_08245 [Sphingomonas sp. UV9]